MKINSVSVQNPFSYIKEKINTRHATAALAALLLVNPIGSRNKAYAADNNTSQTVSYNVETSLDDYRIVPNSDFYQEVLNTNGKYKIEIRYTPGVYYGGAYYKYGNETFDVEGNKIPNPENVQVTTLASGQTSSANNTATVNQSSLNAQKTDFERIYAIYGDSYKVEVKYNEKIGTYYTYAGKNFDAKGNQITVPEVQKNLSDFDRLYAIYGDSFKVEIKYNEKIGTYYSYAGKNFDEKGNQITVPEVQTYATDFDRYYAQYGDRYEIEVKYNEKIGNYYSYAGRAFSLDGKEITLPKTQTAAPSTQTTAPKTQTQTYATDFDRYYAQYGDRYEVVIKYNEQIGNYYSYAGRNFSLEGKEISLPSSGSSSSCSPSSSSSSKSSSNTGTTKSSNPRVKAGSDFDGYYSAYGDRYEIKSHWDRNVGAYYQYGPYAFTKDGKFISNPEKLYHFDTNVK